MHGQHLHALLVEDDDAYAAMLQAELAAESSARVSLERARSLADATQRLAARPFDAVLLDLGLPDSSGLDTYARLASAAGDTPIVVLTASDDDGLALGAVHAGAQDYLVKSAADAYHVARSLRYACERAAAAPQPDRTRGAVPRAGRSEPGSDHAARRAAGRHLQQPRGRDRDRLPAAGARRPARRSPDPRRRPRVLAADVRKLSSIILANPAPAGLPLPASRRLLAVRGSGDREPPGQRGGARRRAEPSRRDPAEGSGGSLARQRGAPARRPTRWRRSAGWPAASPTTSTTC